MLSEALQQLRHLYPAQLINVFRVFCLLLKLCLATVIVKASSGPRYVVGVRTKVDKEKLVSGTRVTLDMTTLTIMRALPREASTLHSM